MYVVSPSAMLNEKHHSGFLQMNSFAHPDAPPQVSAVSTPLLFDLRLLKAPESATHPSGFSGATKQASCLCSFLEAAAESFVEWSILNQCFK